MVILSVRGAPNIISYLKFKKKKKVKIIVKKLPGRVLTKSIAVRLGKMESLFLSSVESLSFCRKEDGNYGIRERIKGSSAAQPSRGLGTPRFIPPKSRSPYVRLPFCPKEPLNKT